MALELLPLAQLDPAAVTARQDLLAQRVVEYSPEADLRRGVIHDVVLHLGAILASADLDLVDRVRRSMSLKTINADPTLADDDLVDAVLANYFITRQTGAPARGSVVVVIDALTPITIPVGMRFIADGRSYAAIQAFTARTNAANVVTDADRVLRPLGDGTFAFAIDLTAVEDGAAGQVRRGTKFLPETVLPHFVRSYADQDFTGGLDTETNAELMARLDEGVASRSSVNRTTTESLLRNQEAFANYLHLSVLGCGDPEQQRYHSLFPVAFGGRVDIYVQTRTLPQTTTLVRKATLVERRTEGGVWQLSLDRQQAPGFYDITQIVLPDADGDSGYEILEDVRGFDLTDDATFVPDLQTTAEAAYSRYQTATIRFLDTDTALDNLTVGTSQQDYQVAVRAMPQIKELQDFLASPAARHRGLDVLVRAPVPCFLSLTVTVYRPSGTAAPDTDAIRNALADFVNRLGFTGRLAAAQLAHVAHQLLTGGQTLSAIEMFGRIRRPDGSFRHLRSLELLSIPDEASRMVSARNCLFFLDPNDIGIDVVAVSDPNV